MAKIKIQGNASGTGVVTLTAPNTNSDRTITLPDEDITLGGGVDGIVSTANATAITIDSSENTNFGGSVPADGLRYLDLFNTSTGSSAGALFRIVTSNATGTGNTTTDIIKYKNSGFLINNNDTVSSNFTAFGVGAAERMRIDSAGRVTMPYQPRFSAHYNVSSPTAWNAANSGADILFTTVSYDEGGNYNSSNGRFTAPVSGYYRFTFQKALNTYGNGRTIRHPSMGFKKNGAGLYSVNCGFSTGTDLLSTDYAHGSNTISYTSYINANEYVTCQFSYGNSPATMYEYSSSHFSAELIG